MKKLFLSSYFAKVASLLPEFLGENCAGKKVAFIPTASNVEKFKSYVKVDKNALQKLGLQIIELDVSIESVATARDKLKKCDYIYIEGGNTYYLLQELKRSGCDKLIVKQIESGKPFIGVSAGSMVMSPSIEYAQIMDDPSFAPKLSDYSALGLVNFYPLPHAENFPFKQAAKKTIKQYGGKLNICPINNDQVILVDGNSWTVKTA